MDGREQSLHIYENPWPEDTECRRLKDLQGYLAKNPGYLDTVSMAEKKNLVAQAYPEHSESRKQCKQILKRAAENMDSKKCTKRRTTTSNVENKWELDTTLELLETMKSYIIEHKLSCIGVRSARWTEVAKLLENPHGLELSKFARSCQVRFENIRRSMNNGKERTQDGLICDSMREYWQICQRYEDRAKAPLKSGNTTPRVPSKETFL